MIIAAKRFGRPSDLPSAQLPMLAYTESEGALAAAVGLSGRLRIDPRHGSLLEHPIPELPLVGERVIDDRALSRSRHIVGRLSMS